jgi:hypothetical protein
MDELVLVLAQILHLVTEEYHKECLSEYANPRISRKYQPGRALMKRLKLLSTLNNLQLLKLLVQLNVTGPLL